jgi:D-alanyl-D-alanine carboxypeptidase
MKKSKIALFIILFLYFIIPPFSIFGQNDKRYFENKENLLRYIEEISFDLKNLQEIIKYIASPQKIQADSFLVLNLSENKIITKKNENKKYPIASITKLMTAVVSLENIDQEKSIILTKEMLKPYGYSPSLFEGLNIKAKDLMYAMLIQSSNDSAEAISYFINPKIFINLMNKKAQELGMINTKFYDSSGLNDKNISTAEDLSKLISFIYKNKPEILKITKENDFRLPDKNQRLLKFRNLNHFYLLQNFVGGKSGYTEKAKNCYVGIFNKNGKDIAIVVLSSKNAMADVLELLKKIN